MTGSGPVVVDASAVADAVLRPDGVGDVVRNLLGTSQCHAPHLIDAELGSILRRLVLRSELEPGVASQRLVHAQRLVDVRHELVGPLTSMAWRLREDVTFYDGLYVALAIGLGQPLVTSDAKLASTAGRYCEVILLGRGMAEPEILPP